jgi:hypothetical protein
MHAAFPSTSAVSAALSERMMRLSSKSKDAHARAAASTSEWMARADPTAPTAHAANAANAYAAAHATATVSTTGSEVCAPMTTSHVHAPCVPSRPVTRPPSAQRGSRAASPPTVMPEALVGCGPRPAQAHAQHAQPAAHAQPAPLRPPPSSTADVMWAHDDDAWHADVRLSAWGGDP